LNVANVFAKKVLVWTKIWSFLVLGWTKIGDVFVFSRKKVLVWTNFEVFLVFR
jgi:hypothetical protein